MEVVYTYNKVDSTNTQEPTPETLEDETKPSHQYVYSERETHEDESYTDIYTSTISRKINQSKSYKITTTSEMYQSGVSEGVKDRVDEFIEMLRTPYSIPSSGIKEAAIDNLENGAEMLFQMLRNGQRTQSLERLMRYILGKATGNDYGVSEFDFDVFDIRNFNNIGAGGVSPFGTNLSREEFINAVQSYSSGSASSRLAGAAGDFYDVCLEYDINPCLAFAWACVETGYGSAIPGNNLFGYAVYNGAQGGSTYATYADSIRDFCEWVINGTTEGTSTYNLSYERGQEFSTVNSHFSGTPASNIYVLFSTYMYLGDTHIADEPDFSNPAGTEYYASHGSTWGAGGRIQIYSMYELGGLYTGEYAERCGHSNGSDPTTLTEKADYAQYCIQMRIKIAENIFGNGCFIRSASSIVEAAYEVADHFLNSGVTVHYGGDSVPEATDNGRSVIGGDIQASWNLPVEDPSRYGVVCATYVSLAIWKAGLIDEATINQYGYNGCSGVKSMLTTSSYASQWQKITNFSELQEGDIVFQPGHVYIYMDGGKCLDQNYCVITSTGSDYRGQLLNASASKFTEAYRYSGG